MLAAGIIGASLAFFEGIALKCLLWLGPDQNFDNQMLNQYKQFELEKQMLASQRREANKETIDKWHASDSKNSDGTEQEVLGKMSRAIVRFLRETYESFK